MELSYETLNGTPIFSLAAPMGPPWDRIWGATRVKDRWIWPAYYPLGALVVADFKSAAPWVMPTPEARQVIGSFPISHGKVAAALLAYKENREVPIDLPPNFQFHLPPFKHQRLGIALGLEFWRLFYLWEMRTGKTKTLIEVIRILRARGQFKRALVLGPPIVRAVWETETELHSNGELTTYAWEPTDPLRETKAKNADIVLVTYAGARNEHEPAQKAQALLRGVLDRRVSATAAEIEEAKRRVRNPLAFIGYDMIIGDESHQFGNWQSMQTEAVIALSGSAARRYALSGTAGDQPAKFYPQLKFLAPGLIPLPYDRFKDRFFIFSKNNPHAVVGYMHLDEMNAKIDRIATRMKQVDCLDMPERLIQDIHFPMGPAQKTRYNELVRDMRATELPAVLEAFANPIDDLGEDDASPEAAILFRVPHGAARVIKLLQITSGFVIKGKDLTVCDGCKHMMYCVEERIKPYTRQCFVVPEEPPKEIIRDFENPKLDVFKSLLENILEGPEAKVIAWGCFTPEIEDMGKVCDALGVKYAVVESDSIVKVKKLNKDFRENPKLRVVLGMISAGIGIDLTPANHMIYYSLTWDRIQYRQSLERNSGPKQTRSLSVYRLLAKDTVSEIQAMTLTFKDRMAYTLTEKIACASCLETERCQKEKNAPFRKGCIYQPDAARPQTTVEEVV